MSRLLLIILLASTVASAIGVVFEIGRASCRERVSSPV